MAVPRIVIQQGRQQLAMAFISDAAHRQQRCVGMIRRAPLPFPVRLPRRLALPLRLPRRRRLAFFRIFPQLRDGESLAQISIT